MKVQSDLSEETIETRISELSDEFARRVGALADLFESWRKPDVSRAVIESMILGDGEAFEDLQGEFDVPFLGKCAWLSEIVEKIARVTSEKVCRLRTDLSPEERRRYLALCMEYRHRGELPHIEAPSTTQDGFLGPTIPPGPFLSALQTDGLVTCRTEANDGGLTLVIGPPSRVCV